MIKSIFLISLISCTIGVSGQKLTRDIEVRNLMWNEDDTIFHRTEFPEEWKDEQAVILAISNDLAYKKFPLSRNLWEQNYTHIRVKILGQQALEEYAQFSYAESIIKYTFKGEIFVGFKIIKPDGQVIIVDEKQAVREELGNGNSTNYGMKKLAIPNLEIGDILDFYMCEELTFYTDKFHSFDPEIFVLRRQYPILNGRISFDVLRRCFINLGTYNGAPDFEVVEGEDDNESRYVLNYSKQKSVDGVPYFYPYRSIPNIKFKVSYASPMGVYQYPSLVDKENPGTLRSQVSPDELMEFVDEYLELVYDHSTISKYMRSNFKGVSDHEELVREAFLYLRNHYAVKHAEAYTVHGSGTPRFSSFSAVKAMTTYLKKAKIPHTLLVGVPRYVGDVEDILLEEEVVLGIKITDPEMYISNFNAHALPGETNPFVAGTKVYRKTNGQSILEKLPSDTKDGNISSSTLEVTPTFDTNTLDVRVVETSIGHFRYAKQELVMDAYDYINEEKDKYERVDWVEGAVSRSDKKAREKRVDEYKEERQKKKLESLRTEAEFNWDFELDSIFNLSITKTGRQFGDEEFEYSYSFQTDDLITKVGSNYLMNIGLLIESQVKIEQEHFDDREFGVYMRFPRIFQSKISVTIPDGYVVQGLEQLEFEVINDTGGFVSSVEATKDEVKINVEKFYNNNFEPKENWADLLAFIKAANDFTQQKMLFRKQ